MPLSIVGVIILLLAVILFGRPNVVEAGQCTYQSGGCSCSPSGGSCSGSNNGVVKFVCHGQVTQCGNTSGGGAEPFAETWGNSQSTDTGCGDTVQIDVFNKNCRAAGYWDTSCQFQSGLVWYAGDCPIPTSPTPVPTSTVIQCNTDVTLAARPNPIALGQKVTFTIPSGDASTYIKENWSGGVNNCAQTVKSPWQSLAWACTATTPGTYTWTHTWRHCVGDFEHCSANCQQTTAYTILAGPTATVTPTRTPTSVPTSAPGPTSTPTPTLVPTLTPTSRPIASTTPKTGAPIWLNTLALTGLGWGGWKMRKLASAFWA